ncbi:MAG: ATP-binding protein [Eubacteriales bacterium]|nr:ATP-binding protein [Eubacteriales bacterium]
MFHTRQQEFSFLSNCYQSIGGQLVVLYGRRRTGKTATLLSFCKGKSAVYYSCTESTALTQLSSFSTLLHTKREGKTAHSLSIRQPKEFSDWGEALAQISEFPGKGKKILVLDEFTALIKSSPRFLFTLRDLWESRLKYDNVMIVLCSSEVRHIEDDLLDLRTPLTECNTGICKMQTMDFYDAMKFFPSYSVSDKLLSSSILGGIPYYLNQFDPDQSFEQNVKSKLLSKGAALYTEPDQLLRRDLREVSIYNSVLEAIALGNNKLGQLYEKTGIEKNKLTVYLKNLGDLGVIEREFSIHDGLREQVYVPHGVYRMSDPFFRFWYSNVFPYLSLLEEGAVDLIYDEILRPKLAAYSAEAFVRACKDYLARQNARGKLPFSYAALGRFWNKEEEFPLMATDEKNTNYLVAECYTGERILTLPYLNKTIAKFKDKKKGAQAYYYCIFSLNGFAEEVRQPALRQGIELVSGAKIFSSY